MSAFFEMGGFAWFVWPCYAMTIVAMVWLLAHSLRVRTKHRTALAALTTTRAPN